MTTFQRDLPLWLFLWRLPGIGPVAFGRILSAFSDLSDLWHLPEAKLKQFGFKSAAIELLRALDYEDIYRLQECGGELGRQYSSATLQLAQGVCRDLTWLEPDGNHLVTIRDSAYPALLKEIHNPPPLLFVQGDVRLLQSAQVAVVGSRHASGAGLQNTRLFVADLVNQGFTVTSGMAQGIDTQAHQASLAIGGNTIAVVGSGIDIVYPKQNQPLAEQIGKAGAVVAEFPTGTRPRAQNFPLRNRIISGLSLGTLVVEATEKSGSLITARLAAEQGREVFAIPGSIHNVKSRGCHRLIKQGAVLVQDSEDFVEHLQGLFQFVQESQCREFSQTEHPAVDPPCSNKVDTETVVARQPRPLAEDMDLAPYPTVHGDREKVLSLLGERPTPLDDIVDHLGWQVDQIAVILMNLQLEGSVIETDMGYVINLT